MPPTKTTDAAATASSGESNANQKMAKIRSAINDAEKEIKFSSFVSINRLQDR